MTKTIQLTLLALFTIFGAANIQSAESQEEASPTQQLYAAINALNVEVVQNILEAHPQEVNNLSILTFPLLYICSLYTSNRSAEEIGKLNEITRALLQAGADPNSFIEYTVEERAQNRTIRRAATSPLTEAASLVGYEHYKAGEFLQILIDYPSQLTYLNAVDGEGQTALYRAVKGVFPRCKFINNKTLRQQNQALKAIKLLLSAGANPQLQNSIESNLGVIIQKTALELITQRVKNNKSTLTQGQRVWDKLTPNIFQLSSQRQIEQYNSNVREAYEMIKQVATCEVAGERKKLLEDIENNFALENHLAYKEDSTASMIATGIKFAGIVGFLTTAHKIASKYGVYTRIATTAKTLARRVAVAAVVAA